MAVLVLVLQGKILPTINCRLFFSNPKLWHFVEANGSFERWNVGNDDNLKGQ